MTDVAQIQTVAQEILRETSSLPRRVAWRSVRAGCRDILRQTKRAGYAESLDAEFDSDWLLDLLPEVLGEPTGDAALDL